MSDNNKKKPIECVGSGCSSVYKTGSLQNAISGNSILNTVDLKGDLLILGGIIVSILVIIFGFLSVVRMFRYKIKGTKFK